MDHRRAYQPETWPTREHPLQFHQPVNSVNDPVVSFAHVPAQGNQSSPQARSRLLDAGQSPNPDTIHTDASKPSDQFEESAGATASVWNTYLEHSTRRDRDMLEGWNKSIDVLLVFAGLFSAVLTTFLVQASTALSPDPMSGTNILLSEIILILHNTTSENVCLSSATSFSPPSTIVWANSLWYASLGLALSAALISILAKQWLQAYAPSPSGTLRERARSRQSLYSALHAWHVDTIIESMPLILHIALLLFFAGLVLYVWTLDVPVAAVTLSIVGSGAILYCGTLLLPLYDRSCPYNTPALGRIEKVFRGVRGIFKWLLTPRHKFLLSPPVDMPVSENPSLLDEATDITGITAANPDVRAASIAVDFDALLWLIHSTTDIVVHDEIISTLAEMPLYHAQTMPQPLVWEGMRLVQAGWSRYRAGSQHSRRIEPDIHLLSGISPYLHHAPPLHSDSPSDGRHHTLLLALTKILHSSYALPLLGRANALIANLTDVQGREISENVVSSIFSLRVTSIGISGETKRARTQAIMKMAKDQPPSSLGCVAQINRLDSLALFFRTISLPDVFIAEDWDGVYAILQFVFEALKLSENRTLLHADKELARDLRLAAAHALFCILFEVGKCEEYTPVLRFTAEQTSFFLVPSFCYLIHHEHGFVSWLERNEAALATVLAMLASWSFYESQLDAKVTLILPVTRVDVVKGLWTAAQKGHYLTTGEQNMTNQSILWCAARSDDAILDLLIQDMEPLLRLMDSPEPGVRLRNLTSVLHHLYTHQASIALVDAFQSADGIHRVAFYLYELWDNLQNSSTNSILLEDMYNLTAVIHIHIRWLASGVLVDRMGYVEGRIEHIMNSRLLYTFYRASEVGYRCNYSDERLALWHIHFWGSVFPLLFSWRPQDREWQQIYAHLVHVPLDIDNPAHTELLNFRTRLRGWLQPQRQRLNGFRLRSPPQHLQTILEGDPESASDRSESFSDVDERRDFGFLGNLHVVASSVDESTDESDVSSIDDDDGHSKHSGEADGVNGLYAINFFSLPDLTTGLCAPPPTYPYPARKDKG